MEPHVTPLLVGPHLEVGNPSTQKVSSGRTVNLALEHYQESMEPDYHVKHIWLAEMQLVSGMNYHLILTLEEADSSSSDEDEDDHKETKSDTCDYKIYKPIQGSPKITSKCLSDL